ncbi:MAG: DUF6851 domain-containing protein [Hormoscilla sp.]
MDPIEIELTDDTLGWRDSPEISPVSFGEVDGEPVGIFFLNPDGTLTDATEEVTPSVLWDEAVHETVRKVVGPTIASRAYAMVHTASFDAWAAYDPEALGTQLGDDLQRPAEENTPENKTEAMSYAAYRVLEDLFPTEVDLFNSVMEQLGLDPENDSTDTTTPAGIGNVSAQALLDFRRNDGSNQLGDLNDGLPYSDYTGYEPVNPPQGEEIVDPNRWQPLLVPLRDPDGVVQQSLTPQWGLVTPFGLESGDQFRPPAPPEFGSEEYLRMHQEVIEINANLTDEQKIIAEFWEDDAGTSFPPGRWMAFGQFVSERDDNTLDEDAQMFFILGNAVMDAGIAAWESKVFYDYVRPITAIEALFGGETIEAWGGPEQGTVELDGSEFIPYQSFERPTPPFAEYVSGHSTFSAAAAEVLQLFTGSDEFGASVTAPPGESLFEPGFIPVEPVTLTWDTFTEAADESGISRLYGGIHNQPGNEEGLILGRKVGEAVWEQAQFFISGGESESSKTLFVFGDSLSDTGNLFNLTSTIGNPIPPSPPYFEGRLSNGPVAVEIMADQLDLSFNLDSNFAWGGAKTGRDNTLDDPDLGLEFPGLLDQIDTFAEAIDSVGADSEALYVVWAGGNDFIPALGAEVPADPEVAVTNAVTNIATAVTTLADLGAETIVVPLLAPMNRTPLANFSGDVEVLADISLAFNAELSETMTSLEEDIEDVDVILVDLFAISSEVAANPQEFGFFNITDPFVLNGEIVDETANVEDFFFWDNIHPTTKGHEIYAGVLAAEIARPVASDDRIVTPQATPVTINVLENDSDPLDDPLEIADFSSSTAGGGAIILEDNGNLLYEPDPEFTGMDSFEYTVTDGEGNTDTATVSVTVTADPPPPQFVNLIRGNPGDDMLMGTQTADLILSFGGDDRINGMSGDDIIFAGPGADNVTGGMGNDLLFGGRGNDLIQGGAGDDTISGESGQDILLGGPGRDVFVLSPETAVVNRNQADVLVDFRVGEDAIGLTDGLTTDDIILESLGTNSIIRIADSNLILGMVNRTAPDELNGSFVHFDLEVF